MYKINEKIGYCQTIGGKKIKLGTSLALIFLFFIISHSFGELSESALSTGKRLFMENNPEDAVIWLEMALKENPEDKVIYNYLGIAYEQIGKNRKAIEIYNKGLGFAGNLKSRFFTNIANNMGILGDYNTAIDYYTQAIELGYNGDAIRNRAGEYLRKQLFNEALKDYKLYIFMEADPYQGDEIRKVINLLEQKLDKIAKREIEEERRSLEEEARQRDLLSQVLNSLSSAGEGTTNISAGTENVEDYNDDFDIVD